MAAIEETLTLNTSQVMTALRQVAAGFSDLESKIRQAESGMSDGVNESMSETASTASGLVELMPKAFNLAIIGGAASAIASVARQIAGVTSQVMNLSDSMATTTAKLNMITGSQKGSAALQEKIYGAAMRSRSLYAEMADTVYKIASYAGDAFSNLDEAVVFSENLSKEFKLAGASTEEMNASTRQLMQALGSGVLRGDELNSVMEEAPGVTQLIADYLDVDKGKIRELASEGAITTDIVKNAILGATDEVNKQFNKLPVTFDDIKTQLSNQAYVAFQPFMQQLNDLINSDGFNSLISGIGAILNLVGLALNGVAQLFEMMGTQALPMAVVLGGAILTAFMPIPGLITISIGLVMSLVEALGGVGAVVSGLFGVVIGVITATGAIFSNLLTFIFNSTTTIANALSKAIDAVYKFFTKIIAAVSNQFGSLVALILKGVSKIAGVVDKIAGTDFAKKVGNVSDKISGTRLTAADVGYNSQLFAADTTKLQYKSISAAYSTGSDIGKSAVDSIKKKIAGLAPATTSNSIALKGDYSNSSLGGEAGKSSEDKTADNTKSTADNTAQMAEDLKAASQELEYLRNIAERQAINRFTTAPIIVNMTNNNSIASNVDLDGIVNSLSTGVSAALAASAEGVHI